MAGTGFDIRKVMEDALEIIKRPVAFYRRMPHSGGYVEPIVFLVVMAVSAGVVLIVFSLFGTDASGRMAIGVWILVMFPLFALIGSFVAAAIMFVIWKLMGTEKSFQTAYRCVAYASAIYPPTVILGLFPYVGTVVGIAWGMYLMAIASIVVHGIGARKTYIVIGVMALLLVVVNVSNEVTMRSNQAQLEQQLQEMGLNMEDLQGKTPEELGRMVGEFMKGVQDGQQQ